MREINVALVKETVKALCIQACRYLPEDIASCLCVKAKEEPYPLAKTTLEAMVENAALAKATGIPICQDTGMAVVFLNIGQEIHFTGGYLIDAINEGVKEGYTQGFLRKSIVKDPLFHRINTNDNTPATVHINLVPGHEVEIIVAPKGFGSENMCQIKMCKPSEGVEGVKKFVLKTVKEAGANACPPMVVGVGIGGNFETVSLSAKKAMLKEIQDKHPDPLYASLEEELLEDCNQLGIGPAGFGGKTTVLGLHIETLPTHIAGMPVAVAICCHVARHQKAVI